ncbi:hypothetical protein [Psychrobacillus sp. NPDC096623]|uniref:hypothetical protein n=1 Tax=Psychrobacillus sp. NPDC096623 TaxID=3364492 RepID=UPI003813F6A6
MFKRILIIFGIFIVGISSLNLLNKPLEVNTSVANKEEQDHLFTKEEELNISTMNIVTEKIHEKYKELQFAVSSNSKKELKIQVEENEEYFDSVNKDIESIAKRVIISSTLKDYTVFVERLDLSSLTEKVEDINQELLHLSSTLMKGLEAYGVIGNINTDYQKSINIQTSIKGSDNDALKLAMQIEETVNEILDYKELKSVSHIDSYEINILNNKGNVVN